MADYDTRAMERYPSTSGNAHPANTTGMYSDDEEDGPAPTRHPITLPMLHLGSFRSLSLKDFTGASPTSDASSPMKSPAPRTPGGAGDEPGASPVRYGPGAGMGAGDRSPRFAAAQDSEDMPTFRASQIPRRLTVVERPTRDGVEEAALHPQRSKSSTREMEVQHLQATPARSGRTHQSEAAELGTLPSSTPGSSVDQNAAASSSRAGGQTIPPVPVIPPYMGATANLSGNDWVPAFPQPPARTPSPNPAPGARTPQLTQEILPLNVPIRQRTPSNQAVSPAGRAFSGNDLSVAIASPSGPSLSKMANLGIGSPLSPERKKRRLPSTPITPSQLSVTPGLRSVSSSDPMGSSGPRAPQRMLSSPFSLDPEQLPQSVQPVRSKSAPGLDPRVDGAEQASSSKAATYSPLGPAATDREQPRASSSRSPPGPVQAGYVHGTPSSRSFADDVRRLRAEDGAAMGSAAVPQIPTPQRLAATPTAAPVAAYTSPSRAGISDYLAMDMSGGPYPVYNRPSIEVEQAQQAQEVGNGVRISQRQAKQPQTPVRVKLPPAQDEVCLECMMRDRDLIHIDVTTEGVWERESDADWRDLLEREREWEWEIQRRSALGQPVDVSDAALLRIVPWRGFDWEEQNGAGGLPEHLRGRKGGMLLEEPLMELTKRNIAPASHRNKTLRKYLRDQALLIDWTAGSESDASHARKTSQYSASGISSSRSGLVNAAAYADANESGYQTLQMVDPERAEYRQSRLAEQEQIVREQQTRMVQERLARERERAMNNRARGNSTGGQARATMYESAYGTAPPPRPQAQPVEAVQQRPMRQQPAAQLDERRGRGISSPGLLENQPAGLPPHMDPNWSPDPNVRLEEQVTPPTRPFSFAVWAGRNGEPGAYSARSSPGPRPRTRYDEDGGSLRSGHGGGFFGRFGGSVTSFFGGSQGGVSGSMMDMHVGLDSDRKYAGSQLVHPRSISMASPPRPRFFGRSSRSSSYVYEPDAAQQRMSQHESAAAPSPARQAPQGSPPTDDGRNKKGFKGFLKKLGGGKKKQKGLSASPEEAPTPRSARTEDDFGMPLAPPPPLSYLVDRSDRRPNHQRTPSGSSGLAPSSTQSYQAEPQSQGWPHPQQRSVSAPLVKSSSSGSLQSTSPTSSRYQPWRDPSGPGQHDSHGQVNGQRRQSGGRMSALSGQDRSSVVRVPDSGVEVLEHDQQHRAQWNEEPHAARGTYYKPPSLTNSSGTFFPTSVESPGLGNLRPPSQVVQASSGAPPLDKQKSLPPLPSENRSPSSPDSFNAFFGDRYTYDERAHPQRQPMQAGWTPQEYVHEQTAASHARRTSAGQQSYSSGRSSLRGDGPEARRSRSRFGLKALFNKDSRRSSAEVQEEPSAEAWQAAQRRGGDPRQRQTYYG